MKCVCVADTHGIHIEKICNKTRTLHIEDEGDVFIHAGDFCNTGEIIDVIRFNEWLVTDKIFARFKYVLVVPGNHDVVFEQAFDFACNYLDDRVTILLDKEIIIDKIKFYGSPWQLPFNNWAFNLPEIDLKEKFNKIPKDTNVLITHSPPLGTLDRTQTKPDLGSKSLADKIDEIRPQFHVFGHIHEGYGKYYYKTDNITYLNVSLLNELYDLKNKPICFEINL